MNLQRMQMVYSRLQKQKILIACVLAVCLALLTGYFNLYGEGPLYNLNDVPEWRDRVVFICFSMFMHLSILIFSILDEHDELWRMLLREVILTITLLIFFLAINQKTYAYNAQVQRMIRVMDTESLHGIGSFTGTNLSAPMLTLLYLISRGPIYDMYLVKLFCIGSYQLLCLAVLRVFGEKFHGILRETVLLLCLILPQGFLSSACAAQAEVFAVLLAVLAFSGIRQGKQNIGMVLYGIACALWGGFFLFFPFLVAEFTGEKDQKAWPRYLCIVLGVACIMTVPAIAMGVSPALALGSLLRPLTALPVVNSGVPGILTFFPRALMEEIPQYGLLRALPELDDVTYAAENYTQAHYTQMMHGLSFASLAAYLGMSVLILQKYRKSCAKRLIILLGVLLLIPSGNMGIWQIVSIFCIYAIIEQPELRLPSVLILFATAGGCCYPVTGETLLAPAFENTLCFVALGMLMEFWPGKGKWINGQAGGSSSTQGINDD